jgi:glutathione S-transferase
MLTVDIMMSFPLQLASIRATSTGLDLTRIKAFLKRMEERPAYQRAIEKGGPLETVDH